MELRDIKGIGPTRLEYLRAVGIDSLRDLLYFFPIRYEDHTRITTCSDVYPGHHLIIGTIDTVPSLNRFQGLTRVTSGIEDYTGRLKCLWYNQPWIMQQIKKNDHVALYGQVILKNGIYILQNPRIIHDRSITPVYRSIKGIPGKSVSKIIRTVLEHVDEVCKETLPASLIDRYALLNIKEALHSIHFPKTEQTLRLAKRRFAFENYLFYQMAISTIRNYHEDGFPIRSSDENEEQFWHLLAYQPTHAQRRALHEICNDMKREKAMSRLVQGDVGCGKTAIAYGAMYIASESGHQAALMAPTEILALQHYLGAKKIFEPLGIHCALLTGSTRATERRTILEQLKNGEIRLVFGTHALISEKVAFQQLGLVITDEQHRFGVRQRSNLQYKGLDESGRAPHVLVMSATPIPRTLAMILYGDLDISIVDEMPPGRIPVKTRMVSAEKRSSMYAFLRGEIQKGHQAYVVCPLIESGETSDDLHAAKETFNELYHDELKGLKIGLTWGSQPENEKQSVIQDFTEGRLDVLVSTTVIEVGVNVPNATVMVIENAERFGLSQLHQLRGRVGRGSQESWCFLLADRSDKLHILSETNDGFEVARKDLELRGPGDLFGTRQSGEAAVGLPLDGDIRLLEETTACLRDLLINPNRQEELAYVKRESVIRFHDLINHIARN